MDDYCARGEPWRQWENCDFIDRNEDLTSEFHGTDKQWRLFEGKWGNIEKLVRKSGGSGAVSHE